MKATSSENVTGASGIIALNHWLAKMGITPITAWRWRKRGWLRTINICGRVYLTKNAIDEFTRRAEAGEFSIEHKFPRRTASPVVQEGKQISAEMFSVDGAGDASPARHIQDRMNQKFKQTEAEP